MTDVCPCHGEPWAISEGGKRRRCRVKKQARDREYATSEAGRARRRRADKTYRSRTFRLRLGSSNTGMQLHLGTYHCTPEQRERITAFRKEQKNGTASIS